MSVVCGLLVVLALSRTTFSPSHAAIEFARSQDITVTAGTATTAARMHPLPLKVLLLALTFVAVAAVPVLIPFGIAIPATTSVLLEAAARRAAARATNTTQAIIHDLRRSHDLIRATA